MDSKAMELLPQFSQAASRGILQPLDWRRFYAFTVYVHRQGLSIEAQDVQDVLTANQWHKDRAGQLAERYENSLELLSYYDRVRSR